MRIARDWHSRSLRRLCEFCQALRSSVLQTLISDKGHPRLAAYGYATLAASAAFAGIVAAQHVDEPRPKQNTVGAQEQNPTMVCRREQAMMVERGFSDLARKVRAKGFPFQPSDIDDALRSVRQRCMARCTPGMT
jgi:hypothetical protein